MTDEQKSALKVIKSLEARVSAMQWRLSHFEDLAEWTKGAQRRVNRETLRLLREHVADLEAITKELEQAFGVGWVEESISSYDFETANMPGVKYTHTTRTMKRVDGEVRHEMSVTTGGQYFKPEDTGIEQTGILAFFTRSDDRTETIEGGEPVQTNVFESTESIKDVMRKVGFTGDPEKPFKFEKIELIGPVGELSASYKVNPIYKKRY